MRLLNGRQCCWESYHRRSLTEVCFLLPCFICLCFDSYPEKIIQDTRVRVETSIVVCKETLQLGSKGYSISPNTGDVIWKVYYPEHNDIDIFSNIIIRVYGAFPPCVFLGG